MFHPEEAVLESAVRKECYKTVETQCPGIMVVCCEKKLRALETQRPQVSCCTGNQLSSVDGIKCYLKTSHTAPCCETSPKICKIC